MHTQHKQAFWMFGFGRLEIKGKVFLFIFVAYVQHAAQVQGSANHSVPLGLFHGEGLSSQHGLIGVGAPKFHLSIGRYSCTWHNLEQTVRQLLQGLVAWSLVF